LPWGSGNLAPCVHSSQVAPFSDRAIQEFDRELLVQMKGWLIIFGDTQIYFVSLENVVKKIALWGAWHSICVTSSGRISVRLRRGTLGRLRTSVSYRVFGSRLSGLQNGWPHVIGVGPEVSKWVLAKRGTTFSPADGPALPHDPAHTPCREASKQSWSPRRRGFKRSISISTSSKRSCEARPVPE
jgi:hypothetical protein